MVLLREAEMTYKSFKKSEDWNKKALNHHWPIQEENDTEACD